MKKINKLIVVFVLAGVIFFSPACQQAGQNVTGSEYVPDMGHSIAYEANYYDYYYYNTWGDKEDYYKIAQPRLPVKGTVARGYSGIHFAGDAAGQSDMMNVLEGQSANAIAVPLNGKAPYYYEDTEEDRTRAMVEITENPFPITEAGLGRAKELFTIYCAICHGDKGDGAGGIYESGIYPAAPANLLNDEFVAASNGRFYHALMYGKNMMGGFTDKLSYEERWQVTHYIRSLQAKEKGLRYDQEKNTLNEVFGKPAGKEEKKIAKVEIGEGVSGEHDSDSSEH